MALDPFKNFAKVQVSTGYDDDDTEIVLETGHGDRLPDASFNAVWWNATDYPDPSDDPNREIVRVTAKSDDTLTVTRAQEGTSASTKNEAGKTYLMIAAITAKTFTDIASEINNAGGGDWDVEIQKSENQDVTNSATLTSDNELSFSVEDGDVWHIELLLIYSGNDTSGDYKGGFGGPNGGGWLNVIGLSVSNAFKTEGLLKSGSEVAVELGVAGNLLNRQLAKFEGVFTCTTTTTLSFRFCNANAASGRTSRTCAGTTLRAKKLSH